MTLVAEHEGEYPNVNNSSSRVSEATRKRIEIANGGRQYSSDKRQEERNLMGRESMHSSNKSLVEFTQNAVNNVYVAENPFLGYQQVEGKVTKSRSSLTRRSSLEG